MPKDSVVHHPEYGSEVPVKDDYLNGATEVKSDEKSWGWFRSTNKR